MFCKLCFKYLNKWVDKKIICPKCQTVFIEKPIKRICQKCRYSTLPFDQNRCSGCSTVYENTENITEEKFTRNIFWEEEL